MRPEGPDGLGYSEKNSRAKSEARDVPGLLPKRATEKAPDQQQKKRRRFGKWTGRALRRQGFDRWMIHGDVSEVDPSLVFLSCCDAFAPVAEFRPAPFDVRRFRRELASYRRWPYPLWHRATGNRLCRPDDAVNVLAALPLPPRPRGHPRPRPDCSHPLIVFSAVSCRSTCHPPKKRGTP